MNIDLNKDLLEVLFMRIDRQVNIMSNQNMANYEYSVDSSYLKYMEGEETSFEDEQHYDENRNIVIKMMDKIIKIIRSGETFEKIIAAIYIVTALRIIYDIAMFSVGISYVNYKKVPQNLLYYGLSIVIPFFFWLMSTRNKYKKYSYRNVKLFGLILSVMSLGAVVLNISYICISVMIVPVIIKIPISADITDKMIVNLSRLLTASAPIGLTVYMVKTNIDLILKPETVHIIEDFKIDRNIDTRKNKNSVYDNVVCINQITGLIVKIVEAVRKYHSLIMGPTGTGKTSMAFTPAIANDLDKRTINENNQKKEVEKMLVSGEAVLTKNIMDSEFDKKYIKPVSRKAKKKLKKIFDDNPLCGATIVAPNDVFGDEVYELCKQRKIKKIYRVDPVLTPEGQHKEGFIGFNPLYINEDLTEFDKRLEIISKSRMFADVLQLIYEAGGTTDVYFSGLNKQITSTMCAIIIKAYPMLHEKYPDRYKRTQACPQEFLDVVTDFELAKDYISVLEDYLRNPSHAHERLDYENKIKVIKHDLLGEGAKTMREQIRGLVNIMSDILANPLVRDVLCAEETIVLDKALAENYITIINYELSLGDSDSRAFGEFFLLSYQNAVFRRPKSNRPLHFLYIDELPVLLHPSMEKIFSLYRQFNVCAAVAIQSLSQFDRQQSTKFMKNVVLNNARTHIVFGGLGPEEMEFYEKIGGKDLVAQVQNTVSESALSLENTSLSYSERTSLAKEDVFSGRDLRNKDFQQATLITLDDKNNVKDAVAVTLNFLTDAQKIGVQPVIIDWSRFYNVEQELSLSMGKNKKNVKPEDIRKKINLSMNAMVSVNNSGFKLNDKFEQDSKPDSIVKTKTGAIISQNMLSVDDKIELIREDIKKHHEGKVNIETEGNVRVDMDKHIDREFKEHMLGEVTLDLTRNLCDENNANDENMPDKRVNEEFVLNIKLDDLVDQIMG